MPRKREPEEGEVRTDNMGWTWRYDGKIWKQIGVRAYTPVDEVRRLVSLFNVETGELQDTAMGRDNKVLFCPSCSGCNYHAVGTDGQSLWECFGCGAKHSMYPTPDWKAPIAPPDGERMNSVRARFALVNRAGEQWRWNGTQWERVKDITYSQVTVTFERTYGVYSSGGYEDAARKALDLFRNDVNSGVAESYVTFKVHG